MDLKDITPLIDRLDLQLDNVEEAIEPLLEILAEKTATLPLLDKAKLYVNIAYALETLLFCSLKLNGTDPKNHPVFRELTRVRQYFDKIKQLEQPKEERPDEKAVDTQAAIRFIRSGLDDNAQVASKLKEQLAKEKAKAEIKKARNEQNKMASAVLTAKDAGEIPKKRTADETSEEAIESGKSNRKKAKKGNKHRATKKKPKNKS